MVQKLNKLTLEAFLEYKTLYYDKIDFSVVQNAWKCIEPHITLPFVIHIVGTNGKGTTGRFLAHYLTQTNCSVLHYTSPHIQHFNERIWIEGEDVKDELLQSAHEALQKWLSLEALKQLTYFEYTTLLALYLSSGKQYLILEAGLGGEFDATNVVKNDLTLVTTLGLDHCNFLGTTLESIAKTKMRSCDTTMIVGFQEDTSVWGFAQEIAQERNVKLLNMGEYNLDNLTFPSYLKRNLSLSLTVLEYLGFEPNLTLFESMKFQGRFEQLLPNVIADVGHNPLAAQQIVQELNKTGQKVVLIYNSYGDKDYESVLGILKPAIKEVRILPLDDSRIVPFAILNKVCDNLNIICSKFEAIRANENYLVFGSFLVVEKIIKHIKENGIDEK